jgi:hypothetical protein
MSRLSATWCFIQIVLVKLSLSVFGFGRTVSRYEEEPLAQSVARTAADESLVECMAHRVAAGAALFPGRALCLEQSLVLHRALCRLGIASRLRFGVHPDPFAGHVWVEVNGSAVNEMAENLNVLIPLEG